jgi:hypothetical protein
MPTEINSYAFCADFSGTAACLAAIQSLDNSGGLSGDAEAKLLLNLLEGDLLKKLYNKTIRVLGILQGAVITPEDLAGDFSFLDFSSIDFNVGYRPGDFWYIDFSNIDFNVGNSNYSTRFQTIINVFSIFCGRSAELSNTDIQGINAVLIPFLDAFQALQNYLIQAGLNPCAAVPVYFNNASSLFLQAAGSDGSINIAEGMHLRWALTGDLGSNHLPKGDYDNGVSGLSGYNQANDYVVISRTPYINPVSLVLDFSTALPGIDLASFRWTYLLNRNDGTGQVTSQVRLTFSDTAQYRQKAALTDPQADPFGFLQSYNGLITVTVDNKNLFAANYDFRLADGTTSAILKLEATGTYDDSGTLQDMVIVRKTVTATSASMGRVTGDNISKLQLQTSAGGFLQSLSFESYDDFLRSRQPADWTVVGDDFALSVTDDVVYGRLENDAYPIDHLWPQYNDGTTVKTANYKDKWATDYGTDISVRSAVAQYLSLSETDPRANVSFSVDSGAPGISDLTLSYLDILNLQAMDFHWARMLGLGHIDTGVNASGSGQYIYLASYINRKSMDSAVMVNYQFMAPPAGLSDSRLPETPLIRPVSYTLPVENGLNTSLLDANGYLSNAAIRAINIGRELYNFESGEGDFNIFEKSTPVFYGVEYRPVTQTPYVKPEITGNQVGPALGQPYYAYDSDNPGGVLETVPVPDNPDSLYIHFEKQSGLHAYALYGINWFSRSSALSAEAQTDETVFQATNLLVPPPALTVQYIQQEDPLLFTTATEQGWISHRQDRFPGQDTGLTRVTFDWLDLTDVTNMDISSAVKAAKIVTWFKDGPPQQVAGLIENILPAPGDDTALQLYTQGYTLVNGTVVTPQIADTDFYKFTGSLLATPEGQFIVNAVAAGPDGPVITVSKIVKTSVVDDPADPDYHGTSDTYIFPAIGSRFTVTENLSRPVNWLPVSETIELIDLAPARTVTETYTNENGVISQVLLIGGINGNAYIAQLNDVSDVPMTGYYSVTFSSGVTLDPHPQVNPPFDPAFPNANAPGALHPPHVEWYNGKVRLPLAGDPGTKKIVEVIRIVQTSPLQVYVYDASFSDDPFQVSATVSDLVAANFHPGYKAYLFPEPPPEAFNGTNILPGAGATDKKTLVGLQSADDGTNGFVSAVSPPAVLLARKIVTPVELDAPNIYGLRVRPDATTRAALTFDITIAPDGTGSARTPYGFMFYRTDNEDVLNALYNPDTVSEITASLALLTTDAFFNERYLELVNLVYDPDSPGNFKVFDAAPDPYGFPLPDKTGLIDPVMDITVAQKTAKYREAIVSTLLPLTAQPPVYALISEGTQTENKQPTLRSVDGNLLLPGDPGFDPYPMIRVLPNPDSATTNYVRFTDYTLNGASRFLYFYGAAEVTSQLAIGPLSAFAGGVTIIQTIPADAPVIRTFTLGPPDSSSTSPIAVTFYLSPFPADEPITSVRIYRTTDLNKTVALQLMDTSTDIPLFIDTANGNGIITIDTFSDLPAVPFGEVIYYRLAFIRTIINERNAVEQVTGLGSAVETITLIDIVNPDAPDLTYDAVASTLSWMPAANKGIYYLYNQNSKGNWQLLTTILPPDSAGEMTYTISPPLVLTDGDGNRIYYRYKVKVQNSAGLFNLTDNELTI